MDRDGHPTSNLLPEETASVVQMVGLALLPVVEVLVGMPSHTSQLHEPMSNRSGWQHFYDQRKVYMMGNMPKLPLHWKWVNKSNNWQCSIQREIFTQGHSEAEVPCSCSPHGFLVDATKKHHLLETGTINYCIQLVVHPLKIELAVLWL